MGVSRQRFKDLANKFVTDTFADFNKTYTFEAPVETPDDQGGFVTTWPTTFATITGFVKPVSESEIILDDHIKSKNIKKFSFEYVAGITSDMRILFDGKYYNINSPASIQESDVWIDVIASESVAT